MPHAVHFSVKRSTFNVQRFLLLCLLPFALSLSPLAYSQGTPLSGVATGAPSRDSRVMGHTSAGVPKQFTIASVIDVYNVKHYGATGNGSTDDTAAIAATFAAAPAGATILFPAGTYKMTSYVTIAADHQTIFGYGAKITSNATGQDRKFLVSGRTGIKFLGLRIDGGNLTTLTPAVAFDTYSPRTEPGTIHLADAVDCEIISCQFTGVNWPITLVGACNNVVIERNRFASYMSAVYGYFSGSGSATPAPKRIRVNSNAFFAGLYPIWPVDADGSPRTYPAVVYPCTGAIKFRGAVDIDFDTYAQIEASFNVIEKSGQMGIEIQGDMNDSVISGNMIKDVDIGISLSFVQRVTVSNNTIRNINYCGIECDGNNSSGSTAAGNDEITLVGNNVDGRDEYGRPANFYNNYGIVITNRLRNVSILGGCLKYLKNGVGVYTEMAGFEPTGITIGGGLRIETNTESGIGGPGSLTQLHGIFLMNARDVDISGVTLVQTGTAWQRMVNIVSSQRVTLRGCTITSGNSPVYIHNSSDVAIEGNRLALANTGGTNPSFITADSTDADCLNLRLANNQFLGTGTYGIHLYAPAHTIGPVVVQANDTTRANATASQKFLYREISGTGAISAIEYRDNIGPGTQSEQTNIAPGAVTITGTVTDSPTWEVINCEWDTTLNLQTAVNYAGKRKRIHLQTDSGTVTITPSGSQTINGATGSITLKGQWSSLELISDGTNWKLYRTPELSGIAKVHTAVFTSDFGDVTAGNQSYVNVTVPCPSGTTNRPSVAIGYIATLPVGLIHKQAYISGANQATVIIANPTGSTITAGSITYRLTVFEY